MEPGTPQDHSPYLWKRSSSPNSLPWRPFRTCWDEQGGEEARPPTKSHCHPGKGPHPAFMPRAVIQIRVGTVHRPMTHCDDPRPSCPILIGFLEDKDWSEGQQQGREAGGVRGGSYSGLPGGRSPASGTASLPGGGHSGERNIPQWRTR